MLYGHFFYPLYFVGAGEAFRVSDAAAQHRYEDLGGLPDRRGRSPMFADRIDWLVERGAIRRGTKPLWDASRALRNSSSHSHRQTVYPPSWALRTLQHVARCVNELYEPPLLAIRARG